MQLKLNDRGIAALAYNVTLREGVKLGLGASFDTQKLDQATHKASYLKLCLQLSGFDTNRRVLFRLAPASPLRLKLIHLSNLPGSMDLKGYTVATSRLAS